MDCREGDGGGKGDVGERKWSGGEEERKRKRDGGHLPVGHSMEYPTRYKTDKGQGTVCGNDKPNYK